MSSEEKSSVDITNTVQEAKWEVGLISAAVAVLSLILVTIAVWLCVKRCKRKAEEDVLGLEDYETIQSRTNRVNNTQSIIISTSETLVDNDVYEDNHQEDDWDYQDFLSVKEINITRYRSSSDLRSLDTFKSTVSIDQLSLCSKLTER